MIYFFQVFSAFNVTVLCQPCQRQTVSGRLTVSIDEYPKNTIRYQDCSILSQYLIYIEEAIFRSLIRVVERMKKWCIFQWVNILFNQYCIHGYTNKNTFILDTLTQITLGFYHGKRPYIVKNFIMVKWNAWVCTYKEVRSRHR